jgi:hypothetical protein
MARLIVLLCGGFLITVVGTMWPNVAFTKGYQFDWSPVRDIIVGTIYYIITLFGILSSILYKELNSLRGPISGKAIYEILLGRHGLRGIIASPLIFVFVINAFGKDANGIMTVAFAYQNGFFWQQILQKLRV